MADETSPAEHRLVDEAPQRRRIWSGVWRSIVVPLVAVGAIVGAIWYIESEGLPFTSDSGSSASGDFGVVELPAALNPTDGEPSPQEGRAAPDFLLEMASVGTIRRSDLQGQPVLLNFWATWCSSCRQEMPDLEQAYEKYHGQGLEILAVNLQEDEGTISRFADEFGMEFPIAIDRSGEVADEYRLFGVPTTFFIDREGIIASIYRGPLVGEDSREAIERSELERRIEEILDEGS